MDGTPERVRTVISGVPSFGMTQWGLDTLFNPAKRHMDEEKRRLQATREELGDSSGGKRIDLESGKVTIRRPAGENEDAAEETAQETAERTDSSDTAPERAEPAAGEQHGAATTGEAASPARELTPAQIRAARRRGREPR